jgi:hypothetical protein
MKILSHRESHIVELDDGSTWRIFPGDLDVTLNWRPETDLKLVISTTRSARMPSSASMTTAGFGYFQRPKIGR